MYAVNLRARIRCPVYLLVIAPDEAVARWAAKIIELGGDSRFVPWVLGPSGVPEITEGRIAIVLKMLASRYGALSRAIEAHVHSIDSAELDEVAERLLTAETVEEALGMVEA